MGKLCVGVEQTECLASILQGAGSKWSAPASAAAAAANITGKEKWLTWHILYSWCCSSHSGNVV